MAMEAPADLRYVSDEEPGFRRRGVGKGFAYYDPHGAKVETSSQLDRIRRLAIPPAWTDVWICKSERGHLQATGRDARGRKQYKYHSEWREFRDRVKFDHLLDFGLALPTIRRRVDDDLALRTMSRDRVVAVVVRLLEVSLVRVGNEEYAARERLVWAHHAAKPSCTDQRQRNGVELRGEERPTAPKFHIASPACARCNAARNSRGSFCSSTSRTTRSGPSGPRMSTNTCGKHRGWISRRRTTGPGSARCWPRPPWPKSRYPTRPATSRPSSIAVELVSRELGNTPAVCRASYIHPEVLEEFRAGHLAERWARASTRSPRLLISEERRLLGVLKQLERARRRRGSIAA